MQAVSVRTLFPYLPVTTQQSGFPSLASVSSTRQTGPVMPDLLNLVPLETFTRRW